MLRKRISLILVLMLLLTGCGPSAPTIENASGPGRMVRRIEVSIHPEDPAYARTYVTQENMNELLSLLRSMQSDEEPQEEPDPNGGQSLYTATVTFAPTPSDSTGGCTTGLSSSGAGGGGSS